MNFIDEQIILLILISVGILGGIQSNRKTNNPKTPTFCFLKVQEI